MGWNRRFAVIVLNLFLLAVFVGAADALASVVDSRTVQRIAEQYKSTVVEIETHIKYSSGATAISGGAGFFIDKDGRVMTAAHVVFDDEDDLEEDDILGFNDKFADKIKSRQDKTYKYWVTFKNKKYRAHFVGSSRYADVAILKLDDLPSEEVVPAALGDSDKVKVGEIAVVIGSPLMLTNSVSSGIISAVHRRDYDLWFIEDFIQTDAPINPGNSGGPLINERGEVIGINDAGYRNADGLGFAVPINLASEYLERMKTEGDLKIAPFGAKTMLKNFSRTGGFEDIKRLSELLDWDDLADLSLLSEISREKSAIVTKVKSDSPAAEAGIQDGDIIISFNNYPVNETFEIRIAMLKTGLAKEIPVKIIRIADGKQSEMTLIVKYDDEQKSPESKTSKHH